MVQTPIAEPVPPEDVAGSCDHSAAAYLGLGGRARYYRCPACGAYLVDDGDHLWQLRFRRAVAG